MKKYQKDFTYSYTVGVYPTLELLEHKGKTVTKLYLHSRGSKNIGVQKIRQIAQERKIHIEMNDGFIQNLSDSFNTYAVGEFTKYNSQLSPEENHLILYKPSDMGNLGTIIRSMHAFNYMNLVFIEPAVDIFNPKVIRSSMGSLFSIKFKYFKSFAEYKQAFPRTLYATVLKNAEKIQNVTFVNPHGLVFGNEGEGLPDDVSAQCQPVTIPHNRNVDSLNVSIAAGIIMYEASKMKS